MEQEFNFNQLKMELYGDRTYVTKKWIANYGKLGRYADYDAYIACIKEAFNMTEIVMGNTIYNFRNRFTYTERVSLGTRNGRERFGYRYQGYEDVIDYGMACTFFGKAKILRMLHFRIPENLDDVRVLRNMTTHSTHTMVGTVADQALSYENVLASMQILGQTLNALGLLRAEDILPEFEKMRIKPGDSVGYSGEYLVQDFIAEGGMSRVYLGLHTRLNRYVAIKELKPYTYREEQIQNEKQFLVSLENSQIPQIFDIFNQNGTYYIIMEYIDGVGLSRYVQETKPDVDERLAIAIQICRVLRYIHNDCNMVYADLKPENVMIERTGRVCLIDFGISQNDGGDASATAYSRFYSSPEQMRGELIDKRSDIYSLGSVLQFLFASNNDQGGITYTDELGDYREEMQHLCEICKRENPADRFPTIDEAEGHLRRIKTEILQQPKAKKRTLRRIILAGVLAVEVLAVAGALAYYFLAWKKGGVSYPKDEFKVTEEGLELRQSLVNRGDVEYDGDSATRSVVINVTYLDEAVDKTKGLIPKAHVYRVTFPCQLKDELGPGEIRTSQTYFISWDDLKTAIEKSTGETIRDELNMSNCKLFEQE